MQQKNRCRTVRGSVMSMIFQDPLETLNPTIPVGKQIMEVICRHRKVSGEEAKARTLELLDMVGIENAQSGFSCSLIFCPAACGSAALLRRRWRPIPSFSLRTRPRRRWM